MRVLLFDPYASGHHNFYLSQVAAEIGCDARVLAVVSEDVDPALNRGEIVGRIPRAHSKDRRKTAAAFRDAVVAHKPDAAIHLFADSDLPLLAASTKFHMPVTLLLFRPRSHYPKEFRSQLTLRERIVGSLIEISVRRWLGASANHQVMTLDEFAARRWASRFGPSRVQWWPEPPAASTEIGEVVASDDGGVVLFGSIAARKGVEPLCRALAHTQLVNSVTIAGRISESFAPSFARCVDEAERSGVRIKVYDEWLSDENAFKHLASASAVALPYPRHFGMSRVLLEAAAAGTPVVGHDFGLMAQQINDFGLGLAVDTSDPVVFGAALDEVVKRPRSDFGRGLREFASRYSAESRRRAIQFVTERAT